MDSGFLLTAGGTALISSLLIQAMKKSPLRIFNLLGIEEVNSKANLIFSIIVSFITSIGIGYKYDVHYDPTTGDLVGSFILSGLSTTSILHGIWHWLIQWVSQHVAYKTIIVPTELQAATVNTLKQ